MAVGERPARIAFFDAYAHDAGAGLALRDIVARIDRERFEPIALLARHGPLAGLLAEAGCPVEVLEPPPPLGVIGGGLATAGAWRKLRLGLALVRYSSTIARWLRAREIDVLHCNQTRAAFAAGPGARIARVPVAWNVRIRERLPQLVVRVAEACAETIIPLTERDFDGLPNERRLLARSIVIRNAVDIERFSPTRDQAAARASVGVADDAPLILSAGVLVPRKGFDVAIRAMGAVAERLPDARLLIAGGEPAGGGCRAELEALVAERDLADAVTLLGPRDDMPELLAACDALVLASRHEGDPAVVLEAMASARPVVATPAAAAAVEDGATGVVVPADGDGALAEALIGLLSDPQAARRMGAVGRAVAEARHDIRAMVRRYEDAWTRMLR